MISNQELLKNLIFLSILWATLSSGSSQWRRKGIEDGTSSESGKENGAIKEGYPGAVSWRSYAHRLQQHRHLNDDQTSSTKVFTKSISVNGGKSRKLEIRNLISSEFENENKTLEKESDSYFPYWKGMEGNASSLDPHQPVWQLPEQKNSTLTTTNKKLKIFPMSSIHELWHATKRILMTDHGNFTNASRLHSSPVTYHNESDIQVDSNDTPWKNQLLEKGNIQDDSSGTPWKDQASHKGDTNEEFLNSVESRGWQSNGGMMKGGGQPILLIKDKGDGGGGDMPANMGMHGKDAIVPIMMMLTPLIMMCIMMPMMMSIMGGMMNFMKGIAMMMMMVSNPLPGIGGQLTGINKHRKTEVDSMSRGRVLLGSLIMEVAEKLETALSKYDM